MCSPLPLADLTRLFNFSFGSFFPQMYIPLGFPIVAPHPRPFTRIKRKYIMAVLEARKKQGDY